MTEQLLVEPTLDLPLSQDDLLHILCDKDDLPDHEHKSTEPHTFAEFTNVIHVASDTDEMKLLSSLHTLGYIEFDVLCTLSNLKEKLLCVLICHGCLDIHIILFANITTKDNI